MAYGDLLVPNEKEVHFTQGLLWFYVLQGEVGIIVLTSVLSSFPSCFPPFLLSKCLTTYIVHDTWDVVVNKSPYSSRGGFSVCVCVGGRNRQ